jgi:hypothetical protein
MNWPVRAGETKSIRPLPENFAARFKTNKANTYPKMYFRSFRYVCKSRNRGVCEFNKFQGVPSSKMEIFHFYGIPERIGGRITRPRLLTSAPATNPTISGRQDANESLMTTIGTNATLC